MASVLGFFPLAGLRVKIGLESRVDFGNLHAVEIEGRKGLREAVVGLPVIAVRCRGDVTGIVIACLRVGAYRKGSGGLVVSGKSDGGERPEEFREYEACCEAQLPCVEDALAAFRDFISHQFLRFQTAFQTHLENLSTMENVLVGVRHAALDAQIAVRVGAFTLHREGMYVILLHGDATVE